MMFVNDPIGYAIHDFLQDEQVDPIIVKADLCEDDILPIAYLFRGFELMPQLEQLALKESNGSILDIGAGTGCHSKWLMDKGHSVKAIDISPGAVDYMKSKGINASVTNLWDIEGQYDTILLLMNGIGLAGKLERLESFLLHLKNHLNPGGQILCDSTDISYLYEEDDGSIWVNLNSAYRGEMQFKMKYKDQETSWFDWLYLDYETLEHHALKVGLQCELLKNGASHNFLCRLKN